MNENTKMENLNKRYSTYKLVTANGLIHPITSPPPPLKKNKTNTNFYTVLKDKNILIDNIHFVWEHNISKIMLMVSTS